MVYFFEIEVSSIHTDKENFCRDSQVNTKIKTLNPVNEVFEAIVDPEKSGIFGSHGALKGWYQTEQLY